MGFDSRRYLTRVLAKAKNLDLQVEYWSKLNAYNNIIEETVVLMLIPEPKNSSTRQTRGTLQILNNLWNSTNQSEQKG